MIHITTLVSEYLPIKWLSYSRYNRKLLWDIILKLSLLPDSIFWRKCNTVWLEAPAGKYDDVYGIIVYKYKVVKQSIIIIIFQLVKLTWFVLGS